MAIDRSQQNWPDTLVQYIQAHHLPATVNQDGTIQTVNEYLDRDGIFHSEPISLPASTRTVREWLGY